MTSEELKERVLSEIGDRTRSDQGWDFRPHLLTTPELRDYEGEMLWTVLIERTANGTDGYHIVFDPSMNMFGLAVGGDCFNLYDSFMDAINGM